MLGNWGGWALEVNGKAGNNISPKDRQAGRQAGRQAA